MWEYSQSTGELRHNGAWIFGGGYSGAGFGRNNPDAEAIHNVGPIPRGLWEMGQAFDSATLGPCIMALEPVGHDAHGRTGFYVHGDAREHPGQASHGCIVYGPTPRRALAASPDRMLMVAA